MATHCSHHGVQGELVQDGVFVIFDFPAPPTGHERSWSSISPLVRGHFVHVTPSPNAQTKIKQRYQRIHVYWPSCSSVALLSTDRQTALLAEG